tara:strand:- start:552 stop:794 length:243 start_codon:yes stop_codon:yes gene_type:complete
MYVPNLKKASRNMTKHMFKDKLGQSKFPQSHNYTPNVQRLRYTYDNPSLHLGAMQLTNLVKSVEEEVNTKRLLNGMFWNV